MRFLEDAVRISFRQEDFRVALGRPFRPVAIGALVVSEAFFVTTGTDSLHTLLFVVPCAVILVCALILAVMCLLYRFEVGPDGIDCYDLLSRPQRTHWASVTQVHPFSLFGLDYLIVNVREQKRALWLPLFVTRYAVLRDLLVTYSDAAHQLDDKLSQAA